VAPGLGQVAPAPSLIGSRLPEQDPAPDLSRVRCEMSHNPHGNRQVSSQLRDNCRLPAMKQGDLVPVFHR